VPASARWYVESGLFDRTSLETLNEDSNEASDVGRIEPAVEVTVPTLELSSGDLFALVSLLKPADDLGDLLVVHRLDLLMKFRPFGAR
jgi:hypothetical protein